MSLPSDSPDPPNPFLGISARLLVVGGLLSIVLAFVECVIITVIWALSTGMPVNAGSTGLVLALLPLLWYANVWAWMAWLGRRRGLALGAVLGAFPPSHPWFQLIAIVIGILGFSLGAFVLSASGVALVAPEFVASLLRDISGNPVVPSNGDVGLRLLTIATLVVVAPIVEEMFFRGLLLQRWAVKWGIRPAILVSSLLFGCLHANPVGLTMFGLVMAVIYIRSRQLWVTILAHSLNNSIAVLLSEVGGTGPATALTLKTLQDGWLIGLVLVGVSLPGLMVYLYRNWPISGTMTPYFSKVGIDKAGDR